MHRPWWRWRSFNRFPLRQRLTQRVGISGCLMIVAAVGLSSVSEVRAEGGNPAKGKGYYLQWCSPCHGETGKGDGMVAASLNPRPRNHTDDKLMSTRTDQDIFQIIKGGGAAMKKSPFMPSFGPPVPTNNWGATLSDQQIWDLVAFIRTLHRGSSSNNSSK